MSERDLEKLSKSELIDLVLKREKKPKVVVVDDEKPGWERNPNTNKLVKVGSPTYKKLHPERPAQGVRDYPLVPVSLEGLRRSEMKMSARRGRS